MKVALLDAGAQAENVIRRRVLKLGYEIDKFPVNVNPSDLKGYDAFIISGGPRSVNHPDSLLPHPDIYKMGKPILGICYGLQAMAVQLGGKVVEGKRGQYGRSTIHISKKGKLFSGLSCEERVLMSHFDTVERIPDGFEIYAKSEGLIAAIGNEKENMYAVQFHPELIPVTKNGNKMFENFLRNIAKFPKVKERTIEQEKEAAKKIIYNQVGSDKTVMHYLSGGVDSIIMALLLKEYIEPDRLFMRTLDTGTMRLGEIDLVRRMAKELGLPNFEVLDVAHRFYDAMRQIDTKDGEILAGPLCYTIDPEHKRKLFGTEYALIALTEMAKISHEHNIPLKNMILGQGTLRPDVIESGDSRVTKGNAHTIKTHHNAVDALKDIPKVEPLIELFKDQVRELGLALGLSEEFVYKQPFPGPGLYCRIIGSKENRIDDDFLKLDRRVEEEAKKWGFHAHALPIRTVGVQGDERSYKHPVIVSGDVDFADFEKFCLHLPNEIRDINRVLYTPGDPLSLEETVSVTPTLMTHDVIQQAQEADSVMRTIAEKYGFNDSRRCSQMPGILIPSNFGKQGERSFVVRPTWTHDFMAIIGMMPYRTLPSVNPEEYFPAEMFFEMAEEIPKKVKGISRGILDPSDKPPSSTEWE